MYISAFIIIILIVSHGVDTVELLGGRPPIAARPCKEGSQCQSQYHNVRHFMDSEPIGTNILSCLNYRPLQLQGIHYGVTVILS